MPVVWPLWVKPPASAAVEPELDSISSGTCVSVLPVENPPRTRGSGATCPSGVWRGGGLFTVFQRAEVCRDLKARYRWFPVWKTEAPGE